MEVSPYRITAKILHLVSEIQSLLIESLIHRNQTKYYRAVEQSDAQGESTVFVEFSLEMILKSIKEFSVELLVGKPNSSERIQLAIVTFKDRHFTRKDYMILHKEISTATASRDLAQAVSSGRLKIKGTKAKAIYLPV